MTQERVVKTASGWPVLFCLLVLAAVCGYLYYWSIAYRDMPSGWGLTGAIALSIVWFILMLGFFTLQPNMSAVLLLFGAYKGTTKDAGFRWANPFLSKGKVSLRAHNLSGERLKVNDKRGNPVEIAVVVVWRVKDTAEACFDVENYKEYVTVQAESAADGTPWPDPGSCCPAAHCRSYGPLPGKIGERLA